MSEKRGVEIFLFLKNLLAYSCFILLCLFFFATQQSASDHRHMCPLSLGFLPIEVTSRH